MKNNQRIVITERMSKHIFAPDFLKLRANRWAIARAITSQVINNEAEGINESLLDERYLTMELEGEPYSYYLKKTIDSEPFKMPDSLLPPAPYKDEHEFINDLTEIVVRRLEGAAPGLIYNFDFEWDDTWDEEARRVHVEWEEPEERPLWERNLAAIVEARGAALPVGLYVNLRGNGIYRSNLIDVTGRGLLLVRGGKLIVAWSPETLRTQSDTIKSIPHLMELGAVSGLKYHWNGALGLRVPFFDVLVKLDENDKELKQKVWDTLIHSFSEIDNEDGEDDVEEEMD